jgi:hypothetical protein
VTEWAANEAKPEMSKWVWNSCEAKKMSMTAETIIKKIDKNYASFIRLYRSLPVTTLELEALPNGWTVKDLLGHIAAWEWHCAESLNQARQSGGLPSVSIDFNELNRKIYEERKDWPWADI